MSSTSNTFGGGKPATIPGMFKGATTLPAEVRGEGILAKAGRVENYNVRDVLPATFVVSESHIIGPRWDRVR